MPAENFKSEKPGLQTALKRFIMKERLRKKEEEAHHSALEKERLEREKKKKLDTMTLEQTKDKITGLTVQLEKLREDKHQLFSELKKVLHREEQKKSQQTTPVATVAATATAPPPQLPSPPTTVQVAPPVQSPSQQSPAPQLPPGPPVFPPIPPPVAPSNNQEPVQTVGIAHKPLLHEPPVNPRPIVNHQHSVPEAISRSTKPPQQASSVVSVKRHRSASPAPIPAQRPPTYAVAHHPPPPPPLGAVGTLVGGLGLHHPNMAGSMGCYPGQRSPFHGGVGIPTGPSGSYRQRSPNPYLIPSLVGKQDHLSKLGPGSVIGTHSGYGTLHSVEMGKHGLQRGIVPHHVKSAAHPPHLMNMDFQHHGRQMGLLSSGYSAAKKPKLGGQHPKMYNQHRGYLGGGHPHHYP